jgi:uncharacterized protein YeaC (DUF1315 family)
MSESFTEQAQALDEQAYQALKQALELSKWPNGDRLTSEQKEICMQTIISYETLHLTEEERSGYMPNTCKSKSADTIAIVQKD